MKCYKNFSFYFIKFHKEQKYKKEQEKKKEKKEEEQKEVSLLFLSFLPSVLPLSFLSFLFFSFQPISVSYALDLEKGKQIFTKNCIVCHIGGNNLIIPEKNLKKDALEENGMNKVSAISYQVLNGKNGMPAFGGRLSEKEIEEVAYYVLEKSSQNFELE